MNDHISGDRRNRSASDLEIAQRKIFIGGLSYDTDDDNLKKYFSKYGNIDDAVVMKDPVTKRSRGFGFITFQLISSVDEALAHEPHTIDLRRVEVKRAVPKTDANSNSLQNTALKSANSSSPPSNSTPISKGSNSPSNSNNSQSIPISKKTNTPPTSMSTSPSSNFMAQKINTNQFGISSLSSSKSNSNIQNKTSRSNSTTSTDSVSKYNSDEFARNKIFVGGLHYDIRDGDFKDYFGVYGNIIYGEVMFNRETHKSRGFGFIIYENEDSVDRVCEIDNHVIHGKAVEVKRAIPRSQLSTPPNSNPQSPVLSAAGSPPVLSNSMNYLHGNQISPSNMTQNNQKGVMSLQPIKLTPKRTNSLSGSSSTALLMGNHNQLSYGNNNSIAVTGGLSGIGVSPKKAVSNSNLYSNSYASALKIGNPNTSFAEKDESLNSYTDQMLFSHSNEYYSQHMSTHDITIRPNRAFSEPNLLPSNFNPSSYSNGYGRPPISPAIQRNTDLQSFSFDTFSSNLSSLNEQADVFKFADTSSYRPSSLSFDEYQLSQNPITRPLSVSPPPPSSNWSNSKVSKVNAINDECDVNGEQSNLSWSNLIRATQLPSSSVLSNDLNCKANSHPFSPQASSESVTGMSMQMQHAFPINYDEYYHRAQVSSKNNNTASPSNILASSLSPSRMSSVDKHKETYQYENTSQNMPHQQSIYQFNSEPRDQQSMQLMRNSIDYSLKRSSSDSEFGDSSSLFQFRELNLNSPEFTPSSIDSSSMNR